jgi:spore coat protein U-like protein
MRAMRVGRPEIGRLAQLALAVLAAGPASASTTSATMAVSAVVEQSCNLDVRPMRFALRSDGPGADADSSLALACTPSTSFVISIDDGQHRSAGVRRMAGEGGNFLAYELYSDAARTRRWGGGLAESVSGQIVGAQPAVLPIYGRVVAAQLVAGAYSDVVTVTVDF